MLLMMKIQRLHDSLAPLSRISYKATCWRHQHVIMTPQLPADRWHLCKGRRRICSHRDGCLLGLMFVWCESGARRERTYSAVDERWCGNDTLSSAEPGRWAAMTCVTRYRFNPVFHRYTVQLGSIPHPHYLYILILLFVLILSSSFFGSSVNIVRWTYVRYCRSTMTQKLISPGPGTFRRAERKEATDHSHRWFRSDILR